MDVDLALRTVAWTLLLPPVGPVFVAIAGLALLRRRPGAGRLLIAGGLVLLLALSMPVVADLLSLAAEKYPPLADAQPLPAGAIVVLSGSIRHNGSDPADAALERRAAGTFHLSVSRAGWKSAHIDGDLITAAGMTPGRGMLRLRVERLDDLQPVVGYALKGSVAGNLSLRPVGRRTYAQLRVDASDILAAGVAGNAQLTASGPLQALAMRLSAQTRPGNCSYTEIRSAARGQRSVARIALSACKDRPLPAGSMPLTVLGANAHGPPDSDKRMCAQR